MAASGPPAFYDNVNTSYNKQPANARVTVTTTDADAEKYQNNANFAAQVELVHQERHKKRVRIARGTQHLLTSILSLTVALMQGSTFISYQKTKDVPGAWPQSPNLLPTLMLFVTAIAACFIDFLALTAYALPQSRVGRKAYALVIRTDATITTFKTIAYTFSTVVCRAGFNFGNSSSQNNDLWSWSCSEKGDAMAKVNNAPTNCTGSTIAWYLAIANIAVQILGIIIDQWVAMDDRKARKASPIPVSTPAATYMPPSKPTTDADEDSHPLLMSADAAGRVGHNKYEKLSDNDYDQLDKISGGLQSQLSGQLPAMPVQQV